MRANSAGEMPIVPFPSLEGFDIGQIEDLGDDGDMVLITLANAVFVWESPGSAESWARVLLASAGRVRELIAERDRRADGETEDR